jgi:hypothetical protein
MPIAECLPHRNFLAAQHFPQPHRRHGATLDRGIIRRHQASLAGDDTYAVNGAAAHHLALAVIIMHSKARERRQLHKRRATVEQSRNTFARQ